MRSINSRKRPPSRGPLLDETRPDLPSWQPWTPSGLRRSKRLSELSYVVIDDMDSRHVALSVAPWPRIDEWGRLRFGSLEGVRTVGVRREHLQAFLRRWRIPRELAGRPVRIGDTFGVKLRRDVSTELAIEPKTWMGTPVYDITTDSREAAKASFFAAVAPTLDPDTDADVVKLARQQRRDRARQGRG